MSKELVIWITIAVYAVFILAVGVFAGRKSKTITDFTVGGRNAGAWMSAFSYGTAYFSRRHVYRLRREIRLGLWPVGRIARYRKRPDRLPAGLAGSGQADERDHTPPQNQVHAPIFESALAAGGSSASAWP